jgi:hypothetical protein
MSADYKSDPRCSPFHDELERPVAPEFTRPKRSTALDGKIKAAIKRAAAGEPSFSSQTYIQAFVASGNRKADEYIRTAAKLRLEPERTAFLSIGGADGSELFSILEATRVRYGALLEWKNSAADLARKRGAVVAKKRKTVKVFEGDAIQKIAEAQAWLKDLRKQGAVDTLCCSVNSLLHELPDRGSNFRLRGFIHSIVDDWKRMLITIREPVRPKDWPSQVELKIRGVRQSTLEAFANYIAQRRRIRGNITSQADDRVLMPSRLAGELLFKTFYLEEFDYEIQESVTSFSSAELERALQSEFGTHYVDVIHLNSDSFNRLYQRFGIEAHDPRAGKELSKPVMFSGLLGFKGIERL